MFRVAVVPGASSTFSRYERALLTLVSSPASPVDATVLKRPCRSIVTLAAVAPGTCAEAARTSSSRGESSSVPSGARDTTCGASASTVNASAVRGQLSARRVSLGLLCTDLLLVVWVHGSDLSTQRSQIGYSSEDDAVTPTT